jgi:ankyrin repeat protein
MKKLLIIIGVTVGLNTSVVAGPIHDAAKSGDIDEIKSLLNIGVSVDHKHNNGATALHVSVYRSNFEVADFLISVGANVNAEDDFGRTPLMGARNVQVASLLINNGAEVGIKDLDGDTAIHRLADPPSDSVASVLELLIASGADVNETNIYGKTPLDIVDDYGADTDDLFFQQLQQAGAKSGLVLLEEKVDQLSTDTTNPTDEWPRKMWEIDLGNTNGYGYIEGLNKSIVLNHDNDCRWVTQDGRSFIIKNTQIHRGILLYLDNKNLVYRKRDNGVDKVILLARNKELVLYNETIPVNNSLDFASLQVNLSPPIGVSRFGTKITGWDFTPPSSTAPKPDDGNGGGNDTVNSRLIIKTAGPDISLATDGKLGGAAELQKSNDLRSWRKLGDVPAEASEVLVTPRESGNEFYRLKKK